jgi:hypothetical protein
MFALSLTLTLGRKMESSTEMSPDIVPSDFFCSFVHLSIHSSHELLERAYSSAKALGIQSE